MEINNKKGKNIRERVAESTGIWVLRIRRIEKKVGSMSAKMRKTSLTSIRFERSMNNFTHQIFLLRHKS